MKSVLDSEFFLILVAFKIFNVIHVINYLLIGENFPSCFTVAGTDWAMVVCTNY